MARNGSGTFNLVTNTWFPPVNGVTATATDWDTFISDIASALTQSVSKDGQTTMTGNLPMGNNKLTGLAAGTATGDSLRWQQLFSQGSPVTLASAATTDIGVQNSVAIEITGTTTITSFGTNYNGPRFLRFTGALILTHNATTLNLPGAANITTVAGDTCIAYPNSAGTGWNVVQFQRGANLLGDVEGASVASASTTDIWTGDGNTRHVTGTTTITSFGTAPNAGARMWLVFDDALILTQGANLNLNGGGSNITTAAGDIAFVYADTTTQFDVILFRKSGASVGSSITSGTALATTSGTSFTFTGIPASAKRVTVFLVSVSTNGTSELQIRAGTSGGVVSSGYLTSTAFNGGTSTVQTNAFTAGFSPTHSGGVAAVTVFHGKLVFENVTGNTWVGTGLFNRSDASANYMVSGSIALGGVLDRVQLTTVNGTDAFDLGSVNISYE